MTRTAIKRELEKGHKVTHRHLEGWIKLSDGNIRDQSGFIIFYKTFWRLHDEEIWAHNWEIV